MDPLEFLDRHPVLGFLLALLMFGDSYMQVWLYLSRKRDQIRESEADQD